MHTLADLQDAMNRLASRAPTDEQLRQTLADRQEKRARRRRTLPYVSVATAVVLIAGGISVGAGIVGSGSSSPAGPAAVVDVPTVPLPDTTRLVRHRLEPVTSPVTAAPPTGLTGQAWIEAPGRLGVSWFDPSPTAFGWTAYTPLSDSSPNTVRGVGYVITESRDEELTAHGTDGPQAVSPSRTEIRLAGHTATLATAPAHATDSLGFPAAQRISWQVPDGHWIHVWADGGADREAGATAASSSAAGPAGSSESVTGSAAEPSAGSAAESSAGPTTESYAASTSLPAPSPDLRAFAETIRNKAQTLDRSIGIGLTLPGLTDDWSRNSTHIAGMAGLVGATLFQCPDGVDPMGNSSGSSSGWAAANPDGTTTAHETHDERDPTTKCLTAAVLHYPDSARVDLPAAAPVTVAGTEAHVDAGQGSAWAELGDGLVAVVAAPESADLSGEDLAALVASVRLSPAVTILPG